MKLLLITILTSLNVISFNMRVGTADDGSNSWEMRKAASVAMINAEKPDLVGVQEALDFQLDWITGNCPDYAAIGVGREDGVHQGEHMSIIYRKSRLQCITWGTFWLSETPSEPSKGWDAACKRTATWALFCDIKTGLKYYVFNTHLDHKGQEARENGLRIIAERIAQINRRNYPVIITGDFNCKEGDAAFEQLSSEMNDTRKTATKSDDTPSFNNWGKSSSTIDYIFQSGFRKCRSFTTLTKRYADIPYISDHYPVKAVLVLPKDIYGNYNSLVL